MCILHSLLLSLTWNVELIAFPISSASLNHAAPPGVYVSVAPNDPTLWTAVIFVRSGM
jgi:hypothetical protein